MGTWTPGPDPTEGNDVFVGSPLNEVALGGGGDDQLFGSSGSDTLNGGDGNDWLYAGFDLDADTLLGGAGNDVIISQGGADTIDGGEGIDHLSVQNFEPAIGVTFDLESTASGYVLLGAGIHVARVESISITLGVGNDVVSGGALNDGIDGADGNDTLVGRGGSDFLSGGVGNDRLDGGDGDDLLNGDDGNDTLLGGAGNDRIFGGTDLGLDTIEGGDGDDTITDGYIINGGTGRDVITSVRPAISIDGGDGDDLLVLYRPADSPGEQFVLSNDGTGSISGGVQVANIEHLYFYAGNGNDTLTLNDFAGALFGTGGNDTLTGGAGDDELDGGSGDDVIRGAGGADFLEGSEGNDDIAGGDGNDEIIDSFGLGDNDSDTLRGDAGDDRIYSYAGVDFIDGGDGVDHVRIVRATGAANYSIDLSGVVSGANIGDGTTLSNVESISLSVVGLAGAVTLNGGNFADDMDGGSGNDLANGGGGNDRFDGRDGDDTLNGGDGNDLMYGGAESDTLSGGSGVDSLMGEDGNDVISDSSGLSTSIDGGDGDDRISIGAGFIDGLIRGGNGIDQLTANGAFNALQFVGIEILNTNGSLVYATVQQLEAFDVIRRSEALPGHAVGLRLSASGQLHLVDELRGSAAVITGTAGQDIIASSDGNDVLYGGAGNDVLDGGSRHDKIYGEAGNDVLYGGAGNDLLDGGDGLDTVSYIKASERVTVNLSLTGSQPVGRIGLDSLVSIEAMIGSNHDDTLIGDAFDNQLSGGNGNDTLAGGGGNDLLVDDAGTTTIINGGAGNDSIMLRNVFTSGTVIGGEGIDELTMFGSLAALTVSTIEILNIGDNTIVAHPGQLEVFDVIRYSAAQPNSAVNIRLASAGAVNLFDELLGRNVVLTGSGGDDVLVTSDLGDYVQAGEGNDTVHTGLGDDTLLGQGGNDVLSGSAGIDFLDGGDGLDVIDGGSGNDTIAQTSNEGRDIINGGSGRDTYHLNGSFGAETFHILTRAEAMLAGITGLAANTEIVITRNGSNTASVIAELDNIEEIEINLLAMTVNDGDGVLGSGMTQGDTIIVFGDFTATSLDYSTIWITGSSANDTVDISGLASAHRVVFESSGGMDRVIGEIRPQDQFNGAFGASDGFSLLSGGGIAQIRSDFAEERVLLDLMLDVKPIFEHTRIGQVDLQVSPHGADFPDWSGADGGTRFDSVTDILLAV